jgi:hydrogenase maturation protein HypF
LFDAFDGAEAIPSPWPARLIEADRDRQIVLDLLAGDLNCPPSSGTGRLFDAAAALLGICAFNHYEAMSPMLLESAASRSNTMPSGDGLLPMIADPAIVGLVQLDHRPLLRMLLERLARDETREALAWLFHDALAEGLARAAIEAARQADVHTIGLSGGVFCNTLLTELMRGRLETAGLETLIHGHVPPNDGGIAYGQAAIAAAITRTTGL